MVYVYVCICICVYVYIYIYIRKRMKKGEKIGGKEEKKKGIWEEGGGEEMYH